jgi:hypothetical protein
MSRKVKLASVFTLAAAAAAIAAVIATQGGASRETAKLSNHGRPISVRSLRIPQAHVASGSVLAVRNDRAFYRFTLGNGDPCFGGGAASDLGTPGSLVCPHAGFPKAGEPILDLSVYEGTRRGVRELSLYRAEGFAADGIAAVQFFRPNGEVALTVPVSKNVFSTSSVPKGPIWGMAALDKDGKRVWRSP